MQIKRIVCAIVSVISMVLVMNVFQFSVIEGRAVANSTTAPTTAQRAIVAKKTVTYIINSPVKNRKIVSYFSKNRNGRPHKGTDYVSKTGSKAVYAFYKGMIVLKGYESSMGNYVVIKHNVSGKIIYSTYMHLKSYKNITGFVKAGRQIGTMGNTGHSFSTHLHFQIGDAVPHVGTNVTFYNGDKMVANGYTFYNSERVITTKFKIIK